MMLVIRKISYELLNKESQNMNVRILLLSVFLMITTDILYGCKSIPSNHQYQHAIEVIIEQDIKLASIRNHASRTKPLHLAIQEYTNNLIQLDFSQTPKEFIFAYEQHIEAWEDSLLFLENYPEIRGEFHDALNIISQQNPIAKQVLEKHIDRIRHSWEHIENIRKLHHHQ